ncbi:hypothetical protein HDU82_007065 [Entophlyctis luteolus]|nr:hypothetical protein HDU82_007065 [Entophlyctis luteolus]
MAPSPANSNSGKYIDSPRRPTLRPVGRLWAVFTVTRPSVLPVIIPPAFAITLWAAAVCGAWAGSPSGQWFRALPASQILTTILGVVMGLLLVFRTNTAYDRFYEGRRMWGTIHSNIRSLARLIWVAVKATSEEQSLHKRGAMRLLIAFASATKHHMRSEENKAFLYKDVGPYLNHIPVFQSLVENASNSNSGALGNSSPDAIADAQIAAIPIEIVFRLQKYITEARGTGQIDANVQLVLTQNVNTLADSVTSFERIRSTPIPIAYMLHVKQTLIVYLLSLPFQIVTTLQWYTVPAVFIAAATMLGIEAIGGEIENPFGYDPNDLPQDEFCDTIREEILAMMGDT